MYFRSLIKNHDFISELLFVQLWCGRKICGGPRANDKTTCPRGQSCVPLSRKDCFTTQCLDRSVCRIPNTLGSSDDLRLIESAEKCSAVSRSPPDVNCALLTLAFKMASLGMVSCTHYTNDMFLRFLIINV